MLAEQRLDVGSIINNKHQKFTSDSRFLSCRLLVAANDGEFRRIARFGFELDWATVLFTMMS